MKKIIVALSLLLPIPCFANSLSGFYIGGAWGQSNLNYNLPQYIQDQQTRLFENQGLSVFSIPYSYQQNFTSSAQKVFVGYDFNRWFAMELTYKDLGHYSAVAGVNTKVNQTVGPVVNNGVTYTATLNGSAVGQAVAVGSASSVGLSMVVTPIHGDTADVFLRLGVEQGSIKWSSNGSYNYQYNYSVTTAPVPSTTTGSGTNSGTFAAGDSLNGLIPVVGLGFDFKLGKHMSLRTEWERTGDPRANKSSIDMYTFGFKYRF